jgi:hypothetical protein
MQMNDGQQGQISTEPEFWRLCWQSVPHYRFLTPVGQCRDLRCVVSRLRKLHVTLDELADDRARPDLSRYVEWFSSCARIAKAFDWDKFEGSSGGDMVRLRPINMIEGGECRESTWYIAEGVHRTLVAGVLLDQGRIQWRPFKVVLVGA